MVFVIRGTTANGSPFYGSEDGRYFIYFDRDCDGASHVNVARWIIDTDRPNQTRHFDLDGDQHCKYLSRTNTGDGRMPPASAEWEMDCGDGKWLKQTITLESVFGRRNTTLGPQKTVITGSAFELSGACGLQSKVNSVFYQLGKTKSGAPYYRSADARHYVYFDPDCSGKGQPNRWIIDLNEPNTVLEADLDSDEACLYIARTSGSTDGPPLVANWFMYCDHGWKEVSLNLIEVASNITAGDRRENNAVVSGGRMVVPGALPFLALVLLRGMLAPS